MDLDGTHLQQLTKDGRSGGPKWSPDGKRIAFISTRTEGTGVYVMNSDGTNAKPLFTQKGSFFSLSWSPDGKSIAFSFLPPGKWGRGGTEVFAIDANGTSAPRVITKDGECPAWSPNGMLLAFSRSKDSQLYLVNTDGSEPRQLSKSNAADTCPAWSPDGKEIAFVSNRSGNYQVYVMNADGSAVRQLTSSKNKRIECWNPSWSANGKDIAFHCRSGYEREVFIVSASGANATPRRLTQDGGSHPDLGSMPRQP